MRRRESDSVSGTWCHELDQTTEYQFAELGQGFVDLPGYFAALEQSGYEGWLAVELDVCYRTRVESARMSRAYLRDTIGL